MSVVIDSNLLVRTATNSADGAVVSQQLRDWHRADEALHDAAYIALAEELDTDVWTLDGPLARNAADAGLPVRLIEVPGTAG